MKEQLLQELATVRGDLCVIYERIILNSQLDGDRKRLSELKEKENELLSKLR